MLTSHYLEPTAKKKVIGKRVEVFHALGYGQPEDAIYFLVLRPLLSMTTLQLDAKGCAHGACVMTQVYARLMRGMCSVIALSLARSMACFTSSCSDTRVRSTHENFATC